MKQAMLNFMSSAGAFDPFRKANRDKALILMYHRFSHGDGSSSTSAHAFGQHLEYLKEHYTLVTISQLAQLLKSGEPLPRSLATITIDDGFRDAYDVAFPLLRRHDAPATLFAVTDFLDQKAWIWTDKLRFLTSRTSVEMFDMSVGQHNLKCELNGSESRLDVAACANELLKQIANEEKDEVISQIASTLRLTLPDLPPAEYAPLTWEQAREMDRNGVEIASHTLTHPILTKVSDEQLCKELQGSRARLETALNRENRSFCYPNGNYDERVIQAAELAGYNCAVSTENGLNTSHTNLFMMRRMPANANFARFVKATSGFEQVQIGLRRSLRD